MDCERLRVILQKEIDLGQLKQQQIATVKELRAADLKVCGVYFNHRVGHKNL